jgi:hypothetical protein
MLELEKEIEWRGPGLYFPSSEPRKGGVPYLGTLHCDLTPVFLHSKQNIRHVAGRGSQALRADLNVNLDPVSR